MMRQVRNFHSLLLTAAVCVLVTALYLTGTGIASEESIMSEIRNAVMQELKKTTSEDIEINNVRIMRGGEILSDTAQYKVNSLTMNGYSGRNRVNFLITLEDARDVTKEVTVEVFYDTIVDIYIASRPLPRGTRLTSDDYHTMKQKSSRLSSGTILDKNEIEGKILKTPLSEGTVLRADYLASHIAIKRGQKVSVMVEGDGLTITTHGVLKNDTMLGGVARVRCDLSKKEVTGILVSPNTVRMKL